MFRTRTPLSLSRKTNTARLACVRPPASVHPEPGSNSPLYVCLTHSKLFYALVFPYSWLYICFSMISLLPLPQPPFSVVGLCRICVCKSKTLFLIRQMFLRKILKFFFSNLNPSQHSTPLLLRSRFTGLQRYKSFPTIQILFI